MVEIKIRGPGQAETLLTASAEENLYAALAAAALMAAPCGGRGTCGKCKLRVLAGELSPQPAESKFFTEAELAAGWRLACLHQAAELTVFLPVEEKAAEIKVDGYLPEFRLADQAGYGIVVDIGSTTLAAALVDLASGQLLARAVRLNSQGAFGQDVLSRISYAGQNENGLKQLRSAILSDLQILCRELLAADTSAARALQQVVIAGNTTMIHILAGVDPSPLGRAPYQMAFTGSPALTAGDLALPIAADCPVYCLPAVSAFVGGDITAGILACRLDQSPDRVLFLDIGTNGEIVLSNQGRLLACSCATGPALEGMNISCGSVAKNGAIEDVSIEDGQVECVTIGKAPATGLCGSGLLAAVAELLRNGLLDARGRLQKISPIQEADGKRRLPLTENLYLTQQDIRQVQLAKGAILAGIHSLLAAAGISAAEVDRVIVAGQFGAHLKAMDLIDCGFLPREMTGKISYAGNTSLSGAYLCLVGQDEKAACQQLFTQVDYLELATLPDYQADFVRCLNFKA